MNGERDGRKQAQDQEQERQVQGQQAQDGQAQDDPNADGSGEELASATKRPYKLLRGAYGRHEDGGFTRYQAGAEGSDIVYLTDREALRLGAKVEPVPEGQFAPSVATRQVQTSTDPNAGTGEVKTGPPAGSGTTLEGDVTANDWSFLSELTWSDAVKAIDKLETVGEVQAAREYEASNRNRKSVLEAADARIEALGDEDGNT